MKKKEKNGKKLIFILRIISLIIILICIIKLVLWQLENSKNSNLQMELATYVNIDDSPVTKESSEESITDSLPINNLEVDFESLKQINSNIVAWIYIPNTNINYSIVQEDDNSYYLTHNFNNEKNSAGWIFADYTNNFGTLDQNTIIYGHNRRNGTMFSNLTYLLDTSWYDDETNKYFNFVTENQSYIAQIFSVYKVSSESVDLSNTFDSTDEFYETINSWMKKSIYDFSVTIDNSDEKIITLYTCDDNTKYRILVHAKLLEIEE